MALQHDGDFKVARLPAQTNTHERSQMLSAGYDKSVRLWDLRMGRCVRSLLGHSSAVFCLQVGARGPGGTAW
jgi:WD40 repeat protein